MTRRVICRRSRVPRLSRPGCLAKHGGLPATPGVGMRLARSLVPVVFAASAAACTTTPAAKPCEARAVGLSLIEAQRVVARFESAQASVGRSDPLNTPKTLDDVQ